MRNNLIVCISLLLFLLLGASIRLPAEETEVEDAKEMVLSETRLNQYKTTKPYSDYLLTARVQKNWFSIVKDWLYNVLKPVLNNSVEALAFKIVSYCLLIGAIVAIVLKISGLSFTSLRKPSLAQNKSMRYYNEELPISETNFDELIQESIGHENYRLAIRYTFLSVLQELNNRKCITWEKEYSNFDYLLQMRKHDGTTEFTSITSIYEEAWYGEMPWTEKEYQSHYNRIKTHKVQLEQTISVS